MCVGVWGQGAHPNPYGCTGKLGFPRSESRALCPCPDTHRLRDKYDSGLDKLNTLPRLGSASDFGVQQVGPEVQAHA
jgi:hypothetical protein